MVTRSKKLKNGGKIVIMNDERWIPKPNAVSRAEGKWLLHRSKAEGKWLLHRSNARER